MEHRVHDYVMIKKPSKSKLPRVLRARVMVATSGCSCRFWLDMELGRLAALGFGAPGCCRGRPRSTRDNILSRPSRMSLRSSGIILASCRSDAVNAGLSHTHAPAFSRITWTRQDYSNFWFSQTTSHCALVSMHTSPNLCDCPTLGNYQMLKIANCRYSNCYSAKIHYMQNYNYHNLLTYYATSSVRKNNNKIYCRRDFVYMSVKNES